MKIAGITKVRNEEKIIEDTINHFSQWCEYIYIYDDCSTDNTVKMCEKFANVKIIRGTVWDKNRKKAEYVNRQRILDEAQKDNPKWILYFDADERIEWDFKNFDNYDVIKMKLFDFYITEEDKYKNYKERNWLGPEYRKIEMLYRNSNKINYNKPDQRIANYPKNYRILEAGYVRHYGKAISIDEWETTCNYYINNFPEPYKSKWGERKGKAIHSKSDFGRKLITWEEKETKGILLRKNFHSNFFSVISLIKRLLKI